MDLLRALPETTRKHGVSDSVVTHVIGGNEEIADGRRRVSSTIDGSGRWIVLETHGLRHTEEFAGRNVTHHRLLPLRRGLLHTQVAMQQHEEAIGLGALIEDRRSLRIANRARFAQEFVLLGGRKSCERRQVGNQGTVDRGHFDPRSMRAHTIRRGGKPQC